MGCQNKSGKDKIGGGMKFKNKHQGSSLEDFLNEEGVLDPQSKNTHLETRQSAARVVGRKLKIELV
jgi:hypothetical protein